MVDEGKDKLGVVGKKKENERTQENIKKKNDVEDLVEENVGSGLDIDWSKVDKKGTLYGIVDNLSKKELLLFWEFYKVTFPKVYQVDELPKYFSSSSVKNLNGNDVDIVTKYFLKNYFYRYKSFIITPLQISKNAKRVKLKVNDPDDRGYLI